MTCRQIMTREAFENAIVTCYALGGSTNMVLHCLALAKEVRELRCSTHHGTAWH